MADPDVAARGEAHAFFAGPDPVADYRAFASRATALAGALHGRFDIRPSDSMALLHDGVGCAAIAPWLGHESAETMQVCLHADLRIKERAMEKTRTVRTAPGMFEPDNALLTFPNLLQKTISRLVLKGARAGCGRRSHYALRA